MTESPLQPPSLHFLELVTQSQRLLYGVLWSLLRNAHDVDDVLQETNAVLWAKSAEYDPSREFLPWALRIAQLQVLAFRKRERHRQKVALDDRLVEILVSEALTADRDVEQRQQALDGCLQKLGASQRALVLRRYEPGGCVNQIAKEQGRSAKAVSESLRRIRAALVECIERTLAHEAAP